MFNHFEGVVEPRHNEPLYNKVLDITNNNCLYPSNSKIYGKGPRYNEISIAQASFTCPFALCYIEVQL